MGPLVSPFVPSRFCLGLLVGSQSVNKGLLKKLKEALADAVS